MPIKTISAAQFAIAFDLRPNLVAWFLDAGVSAASGMPTGYAMIRDFKAHIFCRETNPGLGVNLRPSSTGRAGPVRKRARGVPTPVAYAWKEAWRRFATENRRDRSRPTATLPQA